MGEEDMKTDSRVNVEKKKKMKRAAGTGEV
jgi:hypothetical protein